MDHECIHLVDLGCGGSDSGDDGISEVYSVAQSMRSESCARASSIGQTWFKYRVVRWNFLWLSKRHR